MMRCAIWYHLYNLKNVKNTHGGVLLVACNFTKANIPPWVFLKSFLNCTNGTKRITNVSSTSVSQIIWFNKPITIDNNTIFSNYFSQKILITLESFFEDNGRFKNCFDFNAEHNLNDKSFFCVRIIYVIRGSWKESFFLY